MLKALQVGLLSAGGLVAATTGYFIYLDAKDSRHPEYSTSYSTYYRSTLKTPPPDRPQLQNDEVSDVCVVGGGFAGIHTALGLVERGKKVIVLEQQQVGWGASGMNGGMVLPGFMLEGEDLLKRVGSKKTAHFYGMSVDAMHALQRRIRDLNIDCDMQQTGSVTVSCFAGGEQEAQEAVKEWNSLVGARAAVWPAHTVREMFGTRFFHHGIYEPDTFSVNPLKLILGLAAAAEKKGASIYEHTRVVGVSPASDSQTGRWVVETDTGAKVHVKDVVLAGSAHLGIKTDWRVASSTVPLYTYIMVTEPLGDKLNDLMKEPLMVFDDRFALTYFRPLPDTRLLFGGLAVARPLEHDGLEVAMRESLLEVYPQLEGIRSDYFWGGTLACGINWMPLVGQRKPGLWYATGFCGHGLVPTALVGELLASAIAENDQRYQLFQKDFPLRFAGGPLGTLVCELIVQYYHAMDKYNLWVQERKLRSSRDKAS